MDVLTRRRLLRFHRWIGGACAFFLLVLAITGLALNHSVRLGLDSIPVRIDWVLRHYGMDLPADLEAWAAGESVVVAVDGELYFGAIPLGAGSRLDGVVWENGVGLLLGDAQLFLVTPAGELIDRIDLPVGDETVGALGRGPDGTIRARWDDAVFALDDAMVGWRVETGEENGMTEAASPTPVALSPPQRRALQDAYAGSGLSLYRVLLDAHAGRLFGLPGTLVMDLTAVAILYLVISGLLGWRGRRNGAARPGGLP